MSIPAFQSFFIPLLDIASDGKEHSIKEAKEIIAKKMQLREEALSERLPSGSQTKFHNRIAWAKTYLTQAKLLESLRRGTFIITPRGQELHEQNHIQINLSTLEQYPEFIEFRTRKVSKTDETHITQETEFDSATPEEILQNAYQNIRNQLCADLLNNMKKCSPRFFENLVVKLMVSMGYGGSKSDAGQALGRSGDEGIDGIIKEDSLGLDVIYLQAKRWDAMVGRPEIQKFVGALCGKNAQKGVFMTTGKYSEEAERYANTVSPKVVLIDGEQMANYMFDLDVGVSNVETYQLKKIDLEYFEEE